MIKVYGIRYIDLRTLFKKSFKRQRAYFDKYIIDDFTPYFYKKIRDHGIQ